MEVNNVLLNTYEIKLLCVCVCVLYLYPITLEVNRLNQIVAETKVTLDNQDQATNRDIWNFFLLLFFFIFVGQCDKQTHPFGIVVVKFLSEMPPFQLLHLQLIELWCELILCRQMMWEYIWRRVGKWYGCSTDEACTLVWCVSTVQMENDMAAVQMRHVHWWLMWGW